MTTAGLSALGSTAKALVQIATKPDRQSRLYAEWVEQQDFLEFLRAHIQRDEVVLYATSLPITLPADSPTGLQREHEIRGPL